MYPLPYSFFSGWARGNSSPFRQRPRQLQSVHRIHYRAPHLGYQGFSPFERGGLVSATGCCKTPSSSIRALVWRMVFERGIADPSLGIHDWTIVRPATLALALVQCECQSEDLDLAPFPFPLSLDLPLPPGFSQYGWRMGGAPFALL